MAFEERIHVNGSMLRQFAGQNISIILCVEDKAGMNLSASSTDDQRITVLLPESITASKGDWVEVIGRPSGPTAVKAKEVICLKGDNADFDKEAYNMMVQFMNNCKEIYRCG
ncbi:uncharacterized protein LOC106089162 [Stomoxys calcitrans]|uniref:Replication factor A protein 3 n=1 Tax=Stomoxys calcitrans TaxID=35570 RepID=A0A1I8Q7R4_STOCA|nr:uncharacterized protein LOC106089162 [Stomoxys calcitrans]